MTDLPIIFSGPMVRALIEGRKTMTRRLAWQEFTPDIAGNYLKRSHGVSPEGKLVRGSSWTRVKPGDRLWVRESLKRSPEHHWRYAADGTVILLLKSDPSVSAMVAWAHHKEGNNAPSIHMPRWASRLTLIVTATKIERLQEISNDDCEAEGIESELWDQAVGYRDYAKPDGWFCTWPGVGEYAEPEDIQRRCFQSLWTSLHGSNSWDANPEVIALTFTIQKSNVDALQKEKAA